MPVCFTRSNSRLSPHTTIKSMSSFWHFIYNLSGWIEYKASDALCPKV